MTAGGICEASTEAHHLCTHQQGRRQIPAESVHTQPAAHFRPAGLSIVDATVAKEDLWCTLGFIQCIYRRSAASNCCDAPRTSNSWHQLEFFGPCGESEKLKSAAVFPLQAARMPYPNNRGKSSSSRASCTFCLRQSVPFLIPRGKIAFNTGGSLINCLNAVGPFMQPHKQLLLQILSSDSCPVLRVKTHSRLIVRNHFQR